MGRNVGKICYNFCSFYAVPKCYQGFSSSLLFGEKREKPGGKREDGRL